MQLPRRSKSLLLLPLISLTACAHTTTETAIRTVHDFCLLAVPITYSERHGTDAETVDNKYDSDITVAQVKKHDLTFDAVCQKAGVK